FLQAGELFVDLLDALLGAPEVALQRRATEGRLRRVGVLRIVGAVRTRRRGRDCRISRILRIPAGLRVGGDVGRLAAAVDDIGVSAPAAVPGQVHVVDVPLGVRPALDLLAPPERYHGEDRE